MSRFPSSLDTGPLSGGISQQPPEHRLPGQVSSAANADFSVERGLRTRHGSAYLKRLTGLTAGNDYRVHGIRRDDSEEYALVYGFVSTTMTLRIVRLSDGTVATVNIDADAQTYLNAASEVADLRIRSIADTTLIVNRDKVPATQTAPSYTVTRTHRSALTLQSTVPAANTYHRATQDDELAPAGFWLYGSPQFSYRQFANVSASWDTVAEWQVATQNPCGFRVFLRRRALSQSGCTYTHATKRITYASPLLVDFVETGEEVYITGGTGITAGYYTVTNHTTSYVEFATAPGSGNNTDTVINGVGSLCEVQADFTRDVPADMDDLALTLQARLREAGAPTACIAWIKNTTTGYFTIWNEYDSTEGEVHAPIAPTSGFDLTAAGRPFNSTGSTTGGGGSVSGANPTKTAIDDRWTRVTAPGQSGARIDKTTMAAKLTRTTTSPLVFTLSLVDWDDRLSGDDGTNPLPDALTAGDGLADAAMFRTRLILGAGENLAGSVSGDLFNFYKEDFDQLGDDDPIGAPLGSDQFTAIDFLTPIGDAVVITTRAGRQFELTCDGSLTPASLSIDATTSVQTHPGVRPAVMGSEGTIVLAGPAGGYTAVYRYAYAPSADGSIAISITQHVPSLIPSSVRSVSASPTRDLAIVVPTAGDTLYLYRAYRDGEQVRQAAWTTYTINGTVRDAVIIGTRAVLLVERASQHIVETIELADEAPPAGLTFAPRLDTRISLTGVFSAGNTTWTLPDSLSDSTINRIVLGSAFASNTGREVTVTASGSTVTATGADYSAGAVTVGRAFTMEAELSRPMRRDQNGLGRPNERVHVAWIWASYVDSGPFSVTIEQNLRDNRTRTLSVTGYGLVTGQEQMRLPGDAATCTWTLSSTSARPVQIAGLTWSVHLGPRSR